MTEEHSGLGAESRLASTLRRSAARRRAELDLRRSRWECWRWEFLNSQARLLASQIETVERDVQSAEKEQLLLGLTLLRDDPTITRAE